eukprot:1123366-Amorphochlora_amoeboformis.AAC.3
MSLCFCFCASLDSAQIHALHYPATHPSVYSDPQRQVFSARTYGVEMYSNMDLISGLYLVTSPFAGYPIHLKPTLPFVNIVHSYVVPLVAHVTPPRALPLFQK